jgi:hypothetical protein
MLTRLSRTELPAAGIRPNLNVQSVFFLIRQGSSVGHFCTKPSKQTTGPSRKRSADSTNADRANFWHKAEMKMSLPTAS